MMYSKEVLKMYLSLIDDGVRDCEMIIEYAMHCKHKKMEKETVMFKKMAVARFNEMKELKECVSAITNMFPEGEDTAAGIIHGIYHEQHIERVAKIGYCINQI